mmetsp:Transcript_68017/g.153907  ORF Transcript_68017/g.153907 Transcript_68017/m.153907 type:complete len:267 (+) Transcript_68017:114-914(+)|eukprot:CAMPEP_0172637962 /NCGR_PEP_ID=MMETSP1068-20121228/211647_1 /TAXON_ID=35684 /ORGANISM="Pseudopedinella elastica, Strain CCMP716" /LENGTH=266 /DNA_ID=CAMNT_0013450749 /DNA_START=92 /DNA_END=892 /DNA_ORIENTATION=+
MFLLSTLQRGDGKLLRLIILLSFLLLRSSVGVEDPGFEKVVEDGRVNNGRTRFRGTEGALTVNDAMALKAFAESACQPMGGALRYAEVGSYLGLSATIVADACPRALIYAHDLFPLGESLESLAPGSFPPPHAEDMLVRFWAGVARNGLEGRVVPMRGKSQETLRVHAGDSLDLALVDGDHSYATTLADLRAMHGLVKPGGLLLLHDAVTLDDGVTPHPVRVAALDFAREANTKMFDVEGTWGLVAFSKGPGTAATLSESNGFAIS